MPKAAPAGPPAELTLGNEVEGQLAPGEKREHSFTIDTPKNGSYYGDGLYQLELFVKAPLGTAASKSCTAAATITLKLIDKDDIVVDGYKIGDGFTVNTWEEENWQKKGGQLDFPPGTYRASLTAADWCGAVYKLRLANFVKQ